MDVIIPCKHGPLTVHVTEEDEVPTIVYDGLRLTIARDKDGTVRLVQDNAPGAHGAHRADLRHDIISATALLVALSTSAHAHGLCDVAQALDNALDNLAQALNTLAPLSKQDAPEETSRRPRS
jgi:hypothetical protein